MPALVALWWAGKDDWNKAHQMVANGEGSDCAWVHAHLGKMGHYADVIECPSLIWHIQRGHYGNINLDGLSFVRVGRWEGDLWAGKAKGTAGIFIDERADDQQAEVLPRIFGGHVGGFPPLVAALFAEGRQVRGVERAQIILI